ncbi:MAG: class I SAM-dependent methyltransferase [bacterium]
MERIDFLEEYHQAGNRDYMLRVTTHDKAECAVEAKKFEKKYFDDHRKYGYGGYYYDGRWISLAKKLVNHYDIQSGDKILDVGCAKGFLLYEFTQVVPGVEVRGLDISNYALENAKPEVKDQLDHGHAKDLPYEDNEFDFVFSNNTEAFFTPEEFRWIYEQCGYTGDYGFIFFE